MFVFYMTLYTTRKCYSYFYDWNFCLGGMPFNPLIFKLKTLFLRKSKKQINGYPFDNILRLLCEKGLIKIRNILTYQLFLNFRVAKCTASIIRFLQIFLEFERKIIKSLVNKFIAHKGSLTVSCEFCLNNLVETCLLIKSFIFIISIFAKK